MPKDLLDRRHGPLPWGHLVIGCLPEASTAEACRKGIATITATVEKLTQISGASEGEGNAARNSVADMLNDSTVSAAELRTVLSNVPQIADAIARGLGVSTTQLKLMTAEGRLTNQMVFEGLLKQSAAANDEFAQMPKPLGHIFKSI